MKLSTSFVALAALVCLSGCAGSKDGCVYRKPAHGDHHGAAGEGTSGVAVFKTKDGASIGKAILHENDQGTSIRLMISLPEGERGFHIHETGDCSSPDFKSAGGHFNPHGASHGFSHADGPHLGDLPNISHNGIGRLTQKIFMKDVTLDGEHGIRGKAFIIHEQQDDYISQPTGAAGARYACAVIE